MSASLLTELEPSTEDLDAVVRDLEKSWKATITIRRQSKEDVGYREIFIALDGAPLGILRHGDAITYETTPGAHRLKAHNTLFRRTLDFTLGIDEHARFMTVNRAGWGTYSVFAFWIGFLGAGPFYLTLDREDDAAQS